MKILYIAHRVPYPPNKGDKLRSFHQIDWLSRNHSVWCACFVDSAQDEQHADALRTRCEDVAAVPISRFGSPARSAVAMALGGTVTEAWYKCGKMRRTLGRWSDRVGFDAVLAFSSSMAQYALGVPAPRRILDLCDRDSFKWIDYANASNGPMRWVYRAEGRRLARREAELVQQFDATILITEAEAAGLLRSTPPGKIHVVGNGAIVPDLAESARADFEDTKLHLPNGSHELTVGFVGAMDYRPNVDAVCWFAEYCWPRIRDTFPGAVFRIVGRNPVRRVRRLAERQGVVVVGEVEDVADELSRFDVSVAPMRIARGLQNKVLEAMAYGKPVVASSAAAEGLPARHGKALMIADRPDMVIREVCRLLSDPDLRQQLGGAARQYVEMSHRWQAVLEKFELIVTGLGTVRTASLSPQPTQIDTSVARDASIARM